MTVYMDAGQVMFYLGFYKITGVTARSCTSTQTQEVIPDYCIVKEATK